MAYLDVDHALLGGEVARCDDMLARSVAEHHDGGAAILAACIGDHLRAGLNEMAEVLVGVVLGGVAGLAGLAVDLYEGVLTPAPGRLAMVGEDEVPVVVLVDPIAKVVGEEEEGVLTCCPVHGAVSTFAL